MLRKALVKNAKRLFCTSAACLVLIASSAQALTFNKVFVFGDSISDGGSSTTAVWSSIKNQPTQYNVQQPYPTGCSFESRYTNGLNLMEQAGASLGMLSPNTFQNYAIGGQNTSNLGDQTAEMLRRNPTIVKNDLFLILIGANDFWQIGQNQQTIDTVTTSAVSNINNVVRGLFGAGARKVVVVNLFDLSKLPGLTEAQKTTAASFVSDFNSKLATQINQLSTEAVATDNSATITVFDLKTTSDWFFSALQSVYGQYTLYDPTELVAQRCQELIAANNPPSNVQAYYYNWPIFDKNIFYDGLHLARRSHLYFGHMLSDFLKALQ